MTSRPADLVEPSTTAGVDDQAPPPTEAIELLSAGIDVGSATTHVVLVRLRLERMGHQLASTYRVVDTTVVHESPPRLTPYLDHGTRVNGDRLQAYVAEEYRAAGIRTTDVDVGAALLTGEVIIRQNARVVGEALARGAGEFVCLAAGHHLEARVAAHGSGAVDGALATGQQVLSVDIGGGTTKFSVVDPSGVRETAAIRVGGRLVAHDEDGVVTRLEPVAVDLGRRLGIDLTLGGDVSMVALRGMADRMVDAVLAVANGNLDDIPPDWRLTELPKVPGGVAEVVISGGVSAYLLEDDPAGHRDLGVHLAAALRDRLDEFPGVVRVSPTGMRATVMGVSRFGVEVSGNTIFVSDAAALPLVGIPVARPRLGLAEEIDAREVGEAVQHALARPADVIGGDRAVALALEWAGKPSFHRVSTLVDGLVTGVEAAVPPGVAVVLLFDGDIGATIGHLLADEVGDRRPVVAVDGLTLQDHDVVDIGRVLQPSGAVPVSIKSLVFTPGTNQAEQEE